MPVCQESSVGGQACRQTASCKTFSRGLYNPSLSAPTVLHQPEHSIRAASKAAGMALMQCAANPGFLGAQAGAVAILHTWGQTLVYHPHIHMIVPAGGLSEDMMEWFGSGKKFFISVKALSSVF